MLVSTPPQIHRKLERMKSVCQLVSDDPHWPDINPMIVLIPFSLRREIVNGAGATRSGAQLGTQGEFCDLTEVEQHCSKRLGEDANVLRLNIAVDPIMGVQEP